MFSFQGCGILYSSTNSSIAGVNQIYLSITSITYSFSCCQCLTVSLFPMFHIPLVQHWFKYSEICCSVTFCSFNCQLNLTMVILLVSEYRLQDTSQQSYQQYSGKGSLSFWFEALKSLLVYTATVIEFLSFDIFFWYIWTQFSILLCR